MDYITLIDWHCAGNTLSESELKLLDVEFNMRIQNINSLTSLEVAPPHICTASFTNEGSFWVSCFASVLDQLIPIDSGKTRVKRLKEILDEYNLLKKY